MNLGAAFESRRYSSSSAKFIMTQLQEVIGRQSRLILVGFTSSYYSSTSAKPQPSTLFSIHPRETVSSLQIPHWRCAMPLSPLLRFRTCLRVPTRAGSFLFLPRLFTCCGSHLGLFHVNASHPRRRFARVATFF